MNISSFSNSINADDTHSNEYAANTHSEQTFEQRIQAENERKIISPYRDSKLGASFVHRQNKQFERPKKTFERPKQSKPTRQEMNAGSKSVGVPTAPVTPSRQIFHEPQSRGYNPYS